MVTILSFIVVISILVFFHELGHFLVARACDVYVKDFSIGMGPVIYQFKGKETTYSLRALPIGGAVQMLGEDGVDKEIDEQAEESEAGQQEAEQAQAKADPSASDNPRSFINKPAWQRLLIIAAGPIMNFVLATVLFFIIFLSQGFPTHQNLIGEVIDQTPAQQAGLIADDKIVKINDSEINDWNDIIAAIKAADGQQVQIEVVRANATENKIVNLQPVLDEASGRYIIGIRQKLEMSFSQSLKYAFVKTWESSQTVVSFIPKLISGEVSRDNLAGPIGIAKISGEAARQGPLIFMALMAIISVNLGIMNLLPIPALDGGRILLILLEIIFRKKIPPFIEEKIHLIGFALLMLLMIYVVYNDIVKLF